MANSTNASSHAVPYSIFSAIENNLEHPLYSAGCCHAYLPKPVGDTWAQKGTPFTCIHMTDIRFRTVTVRFLLRPQLMYNRQNPYPQTEIPCAFLLSSHLWLWRTNQPPLPIETWMPHGKRAWSYTLITKHMYQARITHPIVRTWISMDCWTIKTI